MCMHIFYKNELHTFHNYFLHNIINNKITHNIVIKIFLFVYKYTAYFPKLGSQKKGRSRFVGSFSFWTFLKKG